MDVTITQDGDATITHSWSNYKFAQFSDWVNVFKPGTGTITVSEAGSKTPLYTLSKIPLTPGPLVVVIKVMAETRQRIRKLAG